MATENIKTSGTQAKAASPVTSSCHCGNYVIEVAYKPTKINECQCTLCRRYAVAWAYYGLDEVKITVKDPEADRFYLWGDKTHAFHFCGHCGCVMNWAIVAGENDGYGINTRGMKPEDIYGVNRELDYDQLRVKLDSDATPHPDSLENSVA